MEFKKIETNTPYPDFLKINDDNFKVVSNEMASVWKVLTDNYIVDPSIVPTSVFKPLYAIRDDSAIYKNWLYDFNKLETLINHLINKGFNKNDIIRTDFSNFKVFTLNIPETIYFTKDYIDTVNKDWLKVSELIGDMNASLIFYGFKRKENK